MDLKTILKEIQENRAIILDVREKDEWDKSHLALALHFPSSRLNKGEEPENLPSNIPIYVHCAHGRRACMAAERLKAKYPNVKALKIDFNDFIKNGFPVE